MKFRSYISACAAVLLCAAISAEAARKDEITLLLVPREEEAVRLGMDIANRYPSLLISYRIGSGDAVSLHGWTGSEWVNVAPDNFQQGDFFKNGPSSALIVEAAGSAVPKSLIPPPDWCAVVSKIKTTDMRPLLHLVGRYYDFSYDEWKWFARRYSLEMDAINPEGLNVAWYHRPMSEHFKSRPQHGSTDLQYWVSVREPVVPAAAPAAEEAPVDVEMPATDNPLTNSVEEAVVLGPADAEASVDEAAVSEAAPGAEAPAPQTDADEAAAEKEKPTKEAALRTEDPAEQTAIRGGEEMP
jgi:hypothetical protein